LKPNYVIKDYEEKYWNGVYDLFKNIFSFDISHEYFKWKNMDNPKGKSIVKIAVHENKVLGFSGIWKFKLNLNGESILAGQSVDAMVDKNYRRMNIYESAAMEALNDMKEQGLQLRFNFPNKAAYLASIKKLNIKKVCNIPQYIKFLNGKEAINMFSENKIISSIGGLALDGYSKVRSMLSKKTNKYDIREIKNFDQRFDMLWEKVKSYYPIAVERNSQYLNWRYLSGPNKYKIFAAYDKDEVIAYIVTSIEDKIVKKEEKLNLGHIVDLMCSLEHKDAISELIYKAEKDFVENNVCAISCWMIKEWFYSKILTKQAFLQLRSPSVLATLPVSEKMKLKEAFIYDYKNWYVTIGDSDYI